MGHPRLGDSRVLTAERGLASAYFAVGGSNPFSRKYVAAMP
jgi:hypothetical protein